MNECPTCGAPSDGGECIACRRGWARAQRAPGFLPTVELFPELVPPPAPRPATQEELGL